MTVRQWRRPAPEHAELLATAIGKGLEMLENEQGAIFPNLRETRGLGLACDFSGQHQESAFNTYSFLLFDLERQQEWDQARQRVRSELIQDSRRFSYKNLRDNVQWHALEPFLDAAGQLPGLLVNVIAHKGFPLDFVFEAGFNIARFEDTSRFNDWPVMTVAKAAWVVHIAALLVAGFAAPDQHLLWFIDQDELVENQPRVDTLSSSFQDVASDYLSFNLGSFVIITAAADPGHRKIEDVLSIADLAAGAWSDMFNTVRSAKDIADLHRQVEEKTTRNRAKAELITHWCSSNCGRALKYMTIALTPGDFDFPITGQFIYPRPAG